MQDGEFYERVRRVFSDKEVTRDQEFGSSLPSWSMSIDPQTGIVMIAFRAELLMHTREIHALVSVLEMRLQDLSREVRGAT